MRYAQCNSQTIIKTVEDSKFKHLTSALIVYTDNSCSALCNENMNKILETLSQDKEKIDVDIEDANRITKQEDSEDKSNEKIFKNKRKKERIRFKNPVIKALCKTNEGAVLRFLGVIIAAH